MIFVLAINNGFTIIKKSEKGNKTMSYSKKDRYLQIWIYVFAILLMFALLVLSSEQFADAVIEFFKQ